MKNKLDEWGILEGKTLLHIEAPNGVTILSMAKKRRFEADLIAALPDILNTLFAWRSAEIHQAAILIGARNGDQSIADLETEQRTKDLRILTDKIHDKVLNRHE